jgi:hypothetical protein
MRRDLYHIANEAIGPLYGYQMDAMSPASRDALFAGRIMKHFQGRTHAHRRALRQGRIERASAIADELQHMLPAVLAWIQAEATWAMLKVTAQAHGYVWKWPPVLDDVP